MPKQKREKILTSPISEWYSDLLKADAWVAGKSKASQAALLLCSKLQERETRVQARLAYLAKKRGITPEELWEQIISDNAGDNAEPTDDSD